jgi:fluoride ion exporter CrcB/FEX
MIVSLEQYGVNVAGSMLIGFVLCINYKTVIAQYWTHYNGGFYRLLTTFSSFALDAVLLWQMAMQSLAITMTSSVLHVYYLQNITVAVMQRQMFRFF